MFMGLWIGNGEIDSQIEDMLAAGHQNHAQEIDLDHLKALIPSLILALIGEPLFVKHLKVNCNGREESPCLIFVPYEELTRGET